MAETNAVTTAEKGINALTKAEVKLGGSGLQLRNIDELFRFAQAVAGSSLAPKDFVGKPESVMVAIQMGLEIGLPPMAALQNIAVINGRPSVWGDAQLAVVRATGELEAFEETETNNEIELVFRELCFEDDAQKRKTMKIKLAMAQANMKKDADDYGVSCFVRRAGFNEAFSRFTVADAKTAGLWKKQGPWTNYPSRMLKARARSFLLRDQFGDALKGMMSREEAGDIIDITTHTAEVPRAEATPGPAITTAPFRRKELAIVADLITVKDSTGAIHRIAVPDAEKKTKVEIQKIADDALAEIEKIIAHNAKQTEQPSNIIDVTDLKKAEASTANVQEAGEPGKRDTSDAPNATSAVSSQPAASESNSTATGGASPAPKEKAKEFVLPPSRLAPDWLPTLDASNPEETKKSLMEILATEEIRPEELLKWCESRGLSKPKQALGDLAIGKIIGLIKQRNVWRADVLQARG